MTKEKIKNHIGNLHLYVLTGLILIFFGILFLSTAFKDVKMDYTFDQEITTSDIDDTIIGQILLTNNGPITAKVKLKNLIGCDGKNNVNIQYTGTDISNYNYYGGKSLELGSKETKEIKMLLNYYDYKYDNNGNRINLTDLDLYVYQLEENAYTYGYCNSADKVNAFANVKVKIE